MSSRDWPVFYLLEGDGEYAVIETGTSHSVSQLTRLLDARGVHPEQVRYIIPTHVHLDHSRGRRNDDVIVPSGYFAGSPQRCPPYGGSSAAYRSLEVRIWR